MTDLAIAPSKSLHYLEIGDAVRVAEQAASSAGVHVREVSGFDDLEAINRLFDTIWRPTKNPPVTLELLRAFGKAGNYVSAAFDGDTLVGACVGFFAAPADDALHSHIAGVSNAMGGRHVGFALKLHQRAWALLRGVPSIGWTFDPLVSRNAYFNLVKLAAQPAEYLTNFYGGMRDEINAGDDSDRLLVHWNLHADEVTRACAGSPHRIDVSAGEHSGAVVALGVSDTGGPVDGRRDGDTLLVAVPSDIERLRATHPATGTHWRRALRDTLGELMADGARVTGFDKAGWYVVDRAEEGAS